MTREPGGKAQLAAALVAAIAYLLHGSGAITPACCQASAVWWKSAPATRAMLPPFGICAPRLSRA